MAFFNLFRLKKTQTIDFEKINFLMNQMDTLKSPEAMTEKEKEQILSMYSVFYPSLHVIPAQRQDTHHTFLTIYTFIFSAFGYSIFSNHEEWMQLSIFKKIAILALIDAVFLSVTFTWSRMLRSYVNFNYILIKVTEHLEKYLPIRPLETLFLLTKKLNVPTNLSEDMALLPKVLTLLAFLASILVLFV